MHDHQSKEEKGRYTDPVCGMSTDREEKFIRHQHDGKAYYFCSDHCLTKFKANPEKFTGKKEKAPAAEHTHNGSRVYTCPMHPEVEKPDPGSCPKCGMALELKTPMPLAGRTEYTCPMHPEIVRGGPGSCPKCGMALEPKTVSLTDEEINPEYDDMRKWSSHDRISNRNPGPYPFIIGIAAALGIFGFYFGLLTLTSDWNNAKMQFEDYRWWITALSLGLGIQVFLFSFLRNQLWHKHMGAAKSSLAASGGMSTAAMAACCAHYLVPLLPALGLPFLSAAVAGIAEYQSVFFLLGIISNLFGIGFMLRLMYRNGIIKIPMLRKR